MLQTEWNVLSFDHLQQEEGDSGAEGEEGVFRAEGRWRLENVLRLLWKCSVLCKGSGRRWIAGAFSALATDF